MRIVKKAAGNVFSPEEIEKVCRLTLNIRIYNRVVIAYTHLREVNNACAKSLSGWSVKSTMFLGRD